jgi:hypothetical protein
MVGNHSSGVGDSGNHANGILACVSHYIYGRVHWLAKRTMGVLDFDVYSLEFSGGRWRIAGHHSDVDCRSCGEFGREDNEVDDQKAEGLHCNNICWSQGNFDYTGVLVWIYRRWNKKTKLV